MTSSATEIRGLVSVVIPVFNRPAMVREAVQSALGQTYQPVEVLIVDDGSTDETPAVCDEIAAVNPGRIRVVHQANTGAGLAREAGRRLATGEFLQYLDSDDLLEPRKFEMQVRALRDHPDAGVAYGFTRYRRADGVAEPDPWKGSGRIVETMFPTFLTGRWWDTPTPLYRRSVTDAAGPWSGLRVEEDWEYDCRVAALGTRLVNVPEFVVEVRENPERGRRVTSSAASALLRDRAAAHLKILGHARSAGIGSEIPEMQHFARELFLLSRQCGASGLSEESKALFDASRAASGRPRSRGWDFRLYRAIAAVTGWSAAGRLSCWRDTLRRPQSEQSSNRAIEQ